MRRSAVKAPPRGCRSLRRFQWEGARGGAAEAPPCVPLGESIAGGSRRASKGKISDRCCVGVSAGKGVQRVAWRLARLFGRAGELCVGVREGCFPPLLPPVSVGSVARPRVSAEARRRRALSASCYPPPWSRIAGCRWRPTLT